MKKETKQEEIARLKEEFIKYIAVIPIYKLASMFIGKSEDTTRDWRVADKDFSDRVEAARAGVAKQLVKRAKPEFLLPIYYREEFKPPANEHTGDLNFNITRGKHLVKEKEKTE